MGAGKQWEMVLLSLEHYENSNERRIEERPELEECVFRHGKGVPLGGAKRQ